MFLWRNKQNYPLIITKYPPYLFHCEQDSYGYDHVPWRQVFLMMWLMLYLQLESNEDAKLSKILHKQRYHQQQLQQNLVQHDIRQSPQQQQDIRQSPQQQQQQHQQWNVLNKSPQGMYYSCKKLNEKFRECHNHSLQPNPQRQEEEKKTKKLMCAR